ncbi:PAS domain-containing sensor histidine kinase [Hymenobacter guriensis]|uniref:histidine kinase n=1 Tax=Hymenobacter guriensis TaxID=2793065 RepID=A0ABS0L8P7_9BACT|nr:PAS domain-containing protein [Hymenobacter guriensis]MBG8556305.1 PAS domain-containing protein [Hymenobacter guriensis]
MPTSSVPSPNGSVAPLAVLDPLLRDVLAISLTAVNVLRPLHGPSGELLDFTIEYLNPAAQRMTGLPERPGDTTRNRFPDIFTNGVFSMYRRVIETGEDGRLDFNYQADGLDNYFRVAARRSGEWLVVSFTDTADQDRSAVELALRDSQAAEQAARAEAESQRQRFYDALQHLPAQVATYHGPDHVYQFVNSRYQQYFASQPLLGRSIREVIPEVAEQGVFAIMDRVYQTGESFANPELEAWIDFAGTGQPEQVFLNISFYALRDMQSRIDGLLDFSTDVTEQVRARQQLERLNQELETRVQARTRDAERQRRQWEQLFLHAPAAICIFDGPEWVYEFVNPGYQAMFPGRALLGKPLLEALPELQGQPLVPLLRHVYETGEPFQETEVLVPLARYEGGPVEDIYFDLTYTARYNEQGQIDGFVTYAYDVTEQVRARREREAMEAERLDEAELRAQELEDLYQVFEQAPVVVALLRGPEHFFHYRNPAFQGLFPGRPLTGRLYADAMPEIVAAGLMPALDRVYATGQPYIGTAVPFVTTPPDGSAPHERYYDFSYEPYREAGAIVGVSVFAYDVTAQARAGQEREAQRQQLAAVFEQAPVAMALLQGPDYVIEVANTRVAELWGRTPDQVVGQPLLEALPEVRDQGFKELLDQVVATGEAFVAQEVTALLMRKGQLETVYLNFVYQPLRDAEDAIRSVAAVAVEVTGQVMARQQVQRLNEELRASNQELGTSNQRLTRTNVDLDNFVYTASHDLKAPITNIEGLLNTLREELPPQEPGSEVVYILDLMQDSIARFTRTITLLTDVAKLQQEYDQPAASTVLAPVIDAVRLDLAPLLAQVGGSLEVAVEATPTLPLAEKTLRSVVYNLVSNAFKYHDPARPARVMVRSRVEAPWRVLEVQDNGLGLDLTREQGLFTMFRRFHSHVEGSGVGLHMVKKMVENAGGKIEVASKLGHGSTFSVYLPG